MAIMITIVVMLAPAITVAIVITVPMVVVFETAAVAIPVTAVEMAAFVARADPACAHVGRTSPIAAMPDVTAVDGIPVTVNPYIIGTWPDRDDVMARRRGRADCNADGNLGVGIMRGAEHEHGRKQCRSQQVLHFNSLLC